MTSNEKHKHKQQQQKIFHTVWLLSYESIYHIQQQERCQTIPTNQFILHSNQTQAHTGLLTHQLSTADQSRRSNKYRF